MAKKTRGGVSADDELKMTTLSIRMTTRFRDWLAEVAHADRITTVQLIEKAVVEYAERRQRAEAPRRTEGR